MAAICVVQREPWVQQARTPKASEPSIFPYQTQAAIPHSLSLPFRLYAPCNEGFFFFPSSVDNLLKPCCWRMTQTGAWEKKKRKRKDSRFQSLRAHFILHLYSAGHRFTSMKTQHEPGCKRRNWEVFFLLQKKSWATATWKNLSFFESRILIGPRERADLENH